MNKQETQERIARILNSMSNYSNATFLRDYIKNLQSLNDRYREANERYIKIFERMVSGEVFMTFDDNPIEAYKELARHAIKDIIAQSALREEVTNGENND